MSLPEPTSRDAATTESLPALQNHLRDVVAYAVLPVRFVAFWMAALLPLTYLPLLASGVLTGHRIVFVGVLALNAVAFVVGHSYNRPE
jgi:hypothetical protein